ncbi:MAG: cytochrome P450 [Streptomyces sp.]|jgi:cytochrome P450|nr:cytochrome P450 [Streptomyces sp.]
MPDVRSPAQDRPVLWVEEGGYWLVDSPEAGRRALIDDAFGSSTLGPSFELFTSRRTQEDCGFLLDILRRWFVDHDPPEHTAERRACRPRFTRDTLRRLEPGVREAVREVLDRVPADVEAMRDIAHPVAARVIGRALGLEGASPDDLHRWSLDISRFVAAVYRSDHALSAQRSVREMAEFVEAQLRSRSAQEPGEELSDEVLREQIATHTMMLFGGLETSARLLGSLLHAAVTTGRTTQTGPLVDSVLRTLPPIRLVTRIALRDLEFHGAQIRAHQLLLISLRSDSIDSAPLLAFGSGRHLCLGAGLAVLEAQVFLDEFRARYPQAALRADGDPPQASTNSLYSGFERLPLTLG